MADSNSPWLLKGDDWKSPFERVFESWIDKKMAQVSGAFWDGIDGISMLAMCSLQLLSIFGIEWPKRWQIGLVAVYVTLQFVRYAWKLI